MSKQNISSKVQFNSPTVFSASIFLSSTITIFIYMLIPFLVDYNKPVSQILIIAFLIVFAIMLTCIFVLIGTLIGEATKGKAYYTELKNFKDFTDSLHHVSSEVEVYELLYEFTRKIPQVNQATIFYRSDFADTAKEWQKITDENNIPLCSMSAKTCPVIQFGRDCLIENIRTSAICLYQNTDFKTGSYVCLQVIDSGYRQCILQLYSEVENFFDALNISKIKSYIQIAKVVINSGRMVQMLNVKASTDKLTRLYNRSYIDAYLDNEIENALHSHRELSLIVGDIDHFKRINDTYGHDAGDQILILFAHTLLTCTRKSDKVARWGGDEFVIALPDTDLETAQQIAERIVQTISTTKIPPIGGREVHSITCSLGVSTFPEFGHNKEVLMKTADIALYKSKQAGRNSAHIYSPV